MEGTLPFRNAANRPRQRGGKKGTLPLFLSPAGCLLGLPGLRGVQQEFEATIPVVVAEEHILPAVAPLGDVIGNSRHHYSRYLGIGASLPQERAPVKKK